MKCMRVDWLSLWVSDKLYWPAGEALKTECVPGGAVEACEVCLMKTPNTEISVQIPCLVFSPNAKSSPYLVFSPNAKTLPPRLVSSPTPRLVSSPNEKILRVFSVYFCAIAIPQSFTEDSQSFTEDSQSCIGKRRW